MTWRIMENRGILGEIEDNCIEKNDGWRGYGFFEIQFFVFQIVVMVLPNYTKYLDPKNGTWSYYVFPSIIISHIIP